MGKSIKKKMHKKFTISTFHSCYRKTKNYQRFQRKFMRGIDKMVNSRKISGEMNIGEECAFRHLQIDKIYIDIVYD